MQFYKDSVLSSFYVFSYFCCLSFPTSLFRFTNFLFGTAAIGTSIILTTYCTHEYCSYIMPLKYIKHITERNIGRAWLCPSLNKSIISSKKIGWWIRISIKEYSLSVLNNTILLLDRLVYLNSVLFLYFTYHKFHKRVNLSSSLGHPSVRMIFSAPAYLCFVKRVTLLE